MLTNKTSEQQKVLPLSCQNSLDFERDRENRNGAETWNFEVVLLCCVKVVQSWLLDERQPLISNVTGYSLSFSSEWIYFSSLSLPMNGKISPIYYYGRLNFNYLANPYWPRVHMNVNPRGSVTLFLVSPKTISLSPFCFVRNDLISFIDLPRLTFTCHSCDYNGNHFH